MIYKSFEIKNFKGINKVNFDLTNNRIVTLVGLNESGKTTIMDAINLFYEMTHSDGLSGDKLNEYRPKGIDFTGNISIQGTLLLENDDKEKIEKHWKKNMSKRSELDIPDEFICSYSFVFHMHSYRTTDQSCTFNVKQKNDDSSRQLNSSDRQRLIDFVRGQIPEILYYDDFIFQIPDRIYFVKTGLIVDNGVNKRNNQTWQLVINDILKAVNPQMEFQGHVVDVWESDRDAASNRLAQMERALDEKITSRWGELFGASKINFKEIKLEPEYQDGKFSLSFKIKTATRQEFLVKERSKGFKWFFSFLLFTEFRKKRTKNILFLLDEPASNLHSSAQAKILEAIHELSKDSLVIYSTHSHHLIHPGWLGGTYICINENLSNDALEGNLTLTEGAKISAEKYYTYVGKGIGSDKISYFQPILDRLDYKPSLVEPIPNIVILEGKNDWYTLRYFEEIILKRLEFRAN